MTVFFILVFLSIFVALPVLLIWGWIRWSNAKRPSATPGWFSFIGFSFASASALVGLLAAIHARFLHSFPYYDPNLMKIYRIGSILSVLGIVFALGGVWKRGPVRWHALLSSLGMLLFWLRAMTSE